MIESIYKIGLSQNEITEEILMTSNVRWKKVKPREVIISIAQKLIGVPYKFGASVLRDSPNYFDCSSFTAYLYVEAGISIPRMCDDQFHYGIEISEINAKPGDLVFFKSFRTDIPKGIVGHQGVYIGNGEMIQAGGYDIGYGKVVKEKIIESKYYPSGFLGYRLLIPSEEERFVIEIPHDRLDLRSKENLIKELKTFGK
jgi:cell wall-associated NlpC family hydrolase